MKNIVKFQIVNPEGSVTLDNYNPDFKYLELDELLNQYLPYTKLFVSITVKNFLSISKELMSRLTNQYLHGAEITFETPSRGFKQTYKLHPSFCRPFYAYFWKPLDLSAPIPKSLAEFEFEYKGKRTTYLNAIKTLTSTRYLPDEIWNALDEYSKQRINTCKEYNQGIYGCAEEWYNQLMHDCIDHNMKMYSPNQKTYLEVMAEINFEQECKEMQLQKGLRPLTEDELLFLYKYAPAYGIEIPTFRWKINSRKTEHGYTQEPERVLNGMSTADWNKVIYDARNAKKGNILPLFVRQGLNVRECQNDKLIREAYFQLKWIMKHMKDDALMPGYKRCPKCHKLYRESEGCECGYCKPIEFIQAENLFYGNSSAYEDYDSTGEAYDSLDEFSFELEDIEGLEL